VLAPENQEGSRYLVPTHNAAAMSKLCPMLTVAEMEELFQSDAIARDYWIKDENQRKQTYRELISGTDRAALMGMVKTLYRQKASLIAAGKKFHQCDENFLRDAEKRLASELVHVLETDYDRAKSYLREKLKVE
jgi:CarD family transcriptional regulator